MCALGGSALTLPMLAGQQRDESGCPLGKHPHNLPLLNDCRSLIYKAFKWKQSCQQLPGPVIQRGYSGMPIRLHC